VFVAGGDPVQFGLVASLSRPGANVTGLTALLGDLGAKKLALLRDLVPRAATIGFLMNPSFTHAESQLRDMQEAVRALALQIHVLRASTDSEIDSAFESIAQQRIPALAVGSDPFFVTRREQLIAQAARHAVPTMYSRREFAEAGGLMSYGSSTVEVYRQIGLYTGQILNGANPADLPVMQPTKFEFVINLKTAKALGLEFPPGLLAIADEVID
jgi:putative ABC transport system substrate-binding protein